MKMDLSPLDNYTYIQQHGKEMFEKYGARAAFPKAEILSNEEMTPQRRKRRRYRKLLTI